MKSILLIGQSNMAGRGFISEVKPIYNEQVKVLRNGRWQMMVEPLHNDRPTAGIGLGTVFAQLWNQDNEDEIGIIPCAEGGSEISEWTPDSQLFRHAVSECKFAMENSELIAILWHQGESDASDDKYQNYYSKLTDVFTHLRCELDCPDIPILIGELPPFLGKVGFGQSCTQYQLINQQLEKYATENANTYYISAAELTSNPDGIHINSPSIRLFGIRYYQAFKHLSHILNPIADEKTVYEMLTATQYSPEVMQYLAIHKYSMGEIDFAELIGKLGN